MDPLTNSLAAFALSRTGLGRLARHGELAVIVAANLPDLDILSVSASWANLIVFVGGPLHSLFAAPLLAALPPALLWLFQRRRPPFVKIWALAFAGLVLRLALDLTNTGGIQLFSPFSPAWLHLDVLPWFDPWLLLLLAGFAFWPLISYLVNAEMGIREVAVRGVAFATLLLAFGYIGYRSSSQAEALSVLRNHNFGGEAPFREMCFPDTYSLVRVHCVAETESYFANIDYFTDGEFDAGNAELLRKQNSPAAREAQFQSFWFGRFFSRLRMPYWSAFPADSPAGAREVEMRDLVLAPEPHPRFRLRLLMDAEDRLIGESLVVDLPELGEFVSSRRP